MRRVLIAAFVAVCAFGGVRESGCAKTEPAKAKNIILFIGDGMGMVQVQAALARNKGQETAGREPAKFSFESFPAYGYLTTYSANCYVTDSAAAVTALATGQKTNNHMLGVTPNGKKVPNIAELAKQKGKAIGILSSVGFNHATPAGFYAHANSRGTYDDILEQAFSSGTADVLMGGGFFRKAVTEADLKTSAAKAGYKVFTCENFGELRADKVGESKVLGYFDDKLLNSQLDWLTTGTRKEPRLPEVALKALNILERDPDGFFMMVESGSIDWACHQNKTKEALDEVMELDRMVAAVVKNLAEKKLLDQTLIIVTADHETGGMALCGPGDKKLKAGEMPEVRWATEGHTAFPVPVWAQGPGAERLNGKHDNTEVFRAMKSQL